MMTSEHVALVPPGADCFTSACVLLFWRGWEWRVDQVISAVYLQFLQTKVEASMTRGLQGT